jgi:hypothetical protein
MPHKEEAIAHHIRPKHLARIPCTIAAAFPLALPPLHAHHKGNFGGHVTLHQSTDIQDDRVIILVKPRDCGGFAVSSPQNLMIAYSYPRTWNRRMINIMISRNEILLVEIKSKKSLRA